MSAWDAKLIEFSAPIPLLQQVNDLLAHQRSAWPLMRQGEDALARMTTRELFRDGKRVVVQSNPGRIVSTNARVDPASVAHRPCFLCPANLPDPERGVPFGDYVILPNPYPILHDHVTVALRSHLPQALKDRVKDLLALAGSLGPDMFVIYNGPRCGASAPDHMHFQACRSHGVPLFEQLPIASNRDQVLPLTVWGRNMLVCGRRKTERAQRWLESAIATLQRMSAASDTEPMFNVVALYCGDRYWISLFPRAKHRSACYYAGPSRRIAISPAAMEMAGVIVVADPGHFDRVDEAAVVSMFAEVTLGDDLFTRLTEAVV